MKIVKTIFNPAEFTGYHMLGVMTLFFATIIMVNMVLAFNAAGTWTGLMVKNTYVESQNFNHKLARSQAQASLGWDVSLSAADGLLSLSLNDGNGRALSDAIVTGNLGRPVHEGEDRTLSFNIDGDRYSAYAALDSGLWRLQVTAIGPKGEVWVRTIRFHVTNDGKVS